MDEQTEFPDATNKHLVKNEAEYVALFDNFELLDAEDFLGVVFAYTDGTYPDDDDDGEKDVSRTIYKKLDHSEFPEQYPCVVLLINDRDFDRVGDTHIKLLRFVYLSDFV